MGEALFDTAIVVDALIGLPAARAEVARARQRWISRLTWTEVLAGAHGDAERVEEFLDFFHVVELNEEIARRAATLRSQRPAMALADAVVLASAQVTGRILVTRNSADFPAEMPGIRIPYSQ